MRRKLLAGIIILTMIFSLCACGSKVNSSPESIGESGESAGASASSEVTATEDVAYVSEEEGEDKPAAEEIKEDEHAVLYSEFYHSIYLLTNDKITESFDLYGLVGYASYVGLYDRNLVYSAYDYIDDKYVKTYYMMDLDTKEVKKIASFDEASVYANIQSDKLLVITQNSEGNYDENCVDLNTLEMGHGDMIWYPQIYAQESGRTLVDYDTKDYIHMISPNRIMEENGFILTKDAEGNVYKKDKGDSTKVWAIPNNSSIDCYRGDIVIYKSYDENYRNAGLHAYNLTTGEDTVLTPSDYYCYGIAGDYYYFRICTDDKFENGTYELKAYNLKSGDIKTVATSKKSRGVDNYEPGSDLNLINDSAYYLYDNGLATGWFKTDGSKSNGVMLETPIKEYDYFKLGKVCYKEAEIRCPDCDETLGSLMVEYFVFDEDKIPGAQTINRILMENAEGFMANFEDDCRNVTGDYSCDEHGEYYCTYTTDRNITDVFMLGSEYVVFSNEGYDYYGGVHGMPTENSVLFNAKTGEMVNFYDVYTGSSDEFKELVANKTVENYLSYEYGNGPYFADSEESIYSEVMDYIDDEYLPIKWGRDRLIISYPPYVMGPFASGFISFGIDYKELGISFK